jgi:anthranilate phosphoribosyltransferase
LTPTSGHYPLPRRVTQQWIERTAPILHPVEVSGFLAALRMRGWTERDLEQRVAAHLPHEG